MSGITQLLQDADRIIVAQSGQADWRPLFLTGLVSAIAVVVIVVLVAIAFWRAFR